MTIKAFPNGTHSIAKHTGRQSPRAIRSKVTARIPAPDAICLLSSRLPNENKRLNCPSTAAWYRWDFPIPMFRCGFILFICENSLSYSCTKGNLFFASLLHFRCISAMLQMLSGETGASPVRVRRREALILPFLPKLPQVPGQGHWSFPRRPNGLRQVGISGQKNPHKSCETGLWEI